MTMNLATTVPDEITRFRQQLQRSLEAAGPGEPATPTGWQILACIFDVLNRPIDGKNPVEAWQLREYTKYSEFPGVGISDGHAGYEILLTSIHRHTDSYLATVAGEFGLELNEFKLLAASIAPPDNPPAIEPPGGTQILLWMPSRKTYISVPPGGDLTLEAIRKYARGFENTTVVSWI